MPQCILECVIHTDTCIMESVAFTFISIGSDPMTQETTLPQINWGNVD
ncbi:hypothetical protein ECOLI_210015 [Escherichia coli]|uniref:Uncharacterized protein n=1 Tax=Klebsiella pneumoniae TaxID=573 RepID=A0A345WYT3_KLEPN|nr:hypothetical protein [Klebsiella pneumoniae]CTQ81738.1 hypothetical protein ECOLI_210015 [Escherichia coli]